MSDGCKGSSAFNIVNGRSWFPQAIYNPILYCCNVGFHHNTMLGGLMFALLIGDIAGKYVDPTLPNTGVR